MANADLVSRLAMIKEYFDRSTRPLEEADSGFAPAPGMFTVAQLVAHVAQTVDWYLENRSWWEPLRASGHGQKRLGLLDKAVS